MLFGTARVRQGVPPTWATLALKALASARLQHVHRAAWVEVWVMIGEVQLSRVGLAVAVAVVGEKRERRSWIACDSWIWACAVA